ncbi:MAG: CPBP family intramembrane glutamic endopeptidase [Gemmatimonadaceae bacterium]
MASGYEREAAPPLKDRLAEDLRGFGPLGILAIVVILAGNFVVAPLSAVLVLLWAWRSHTPWRELGFVRPESWIRTATIGIVFGVLLKFIVKMIVMPLLGGPPINPAYHYLAGNAAALPGILIAVIVVAGFGEETLFRGYLFERSRRLFGSSVLAKTLTVVFTAAFFGSLHYREQGLAGAEQAVITGLVFGTIFAITGRIWMLMFAHAAYDLTAIALIYLNLETPVAHFLFK